MIGIVPYRERVEGDSQFLSRHKVGKVALVTVELDSSMDIDETPSEIGMHE